MNDIYKTPKSNLIEKNNALPLSNSNNKTSTGKTRFPWTFGFRWVIFIISIFGFLSALIAIGSLPDSVPIMYTIFPVSMQILFVTAAWLLLKKRKIALILFTVHLLISYVSTVISAPVLIGNVYNIAGWIFSIFSIFLCVYLFQRKELR